MASFFGAVSVVSTLSEGCDDSPHPTMSRARARESRTGFIPRSKRLLGRGSRVGGLVDWFAVLVGRAMLFRPVLFVSNHNPIPTLDSPMRRLIQYGHEID